MDPHLGSLEPHSPGSEASPISSIGEFQYRQEYMETSPEYTGHSPSHNPHYTVLTDLDYLTDLLPPTEPSMDLSSMSWAAQTSNEANHPSINPTADLHQSLWYQVYDSNTATALQHYQL